MPEREPLYHYVPSVPAAAVFIALFAISTCLHFKQLYSFKSWYFLAMAIGGGMEVIGYAARIVSSGNPTSLGLYIIQTLMILLAPALFAASIYVILGRLIVTLNGEELSLIRVTRLTKFFVLGDVFSFLLQSAGGGLSSSASSANLGKTVILIGLAVQIIWFGFFVVVAAVFHMRMKKRHMYTAPPGWATLLWILYAASVLILVRSVFRLIEYGGGRDGYLMRKEVFLYVFDAVLMFGVMVAFNVVHPGKELIRLNEAKLSEGYTMDERQ